MFVDKFNGPMDYTIIPITDDVKVSDNVATCDEKQQFVNVRLPPENKVCCLCKTQHCMLNVVTTRTEDKRSKEERLLLHVGFMEKYRNDKNLLNARKTVHFIVGKEKQLMVASDLLSVLTVSPVSQARFSSRWTMNSEVLEMEIPDVEPLTFQVLICWIESLGAHLGGRKCETIQTVAGGTTPWVTADTVWSVLAAANEYQVQSLADHCFNFLLQHHPRCRRSRHLCTVVELAHSLGCAAPRAQGLGLLKQSAARLLKNARALAELCHDCMLELVKADDLLIQKNEEVLVYDAVVTWYTQACAKGGGNSTPERAAALLAEGRDLLRHVRWGLIARQTLGNIVLQAACNNDTSSPCRGLLTGADLQRLAHKDHEKVQYRQRQEARGKTSWRTQCCKRKLACASVITGLIMLLVILFLVVFSQLREGSSQLKDSSYASVNYGGRRQLFDSPIQ